MDSTKDGWKLMEKTVSQELWSPILFPVLLQQLHYEIVFVQMSHASCDSGYVVQCAKDPGLKRELSIFSLQTSSFKKDGAFLVFILSCVVVFLR